MHLKSLEIMGFKSFGRKTVFDFQPGLTAIIGPNGSGKSNVCDAIRWVLGEQSPKALRGTKMSEVIFAGSSEYRPSAFAQVKLVLDNEDHTMPIDFSEVSIGRQLFRSGESNYIVNNTRTLLGNVKEMLMDTGIGKDGYSVIGQGDIDDIVFQRSQSRRELIEEAAGITRFKHRKENALAKLEHTRANVTRISDIVIEIENQLGPLAEQAEKTRQYQALAAEIKQLEIDLVLYDLNAFYGRRENINSMRLGLLAKIDEIEKFVSEVEEKKAGAKAKFDEFNNALQDRQNKVDGIDKEINSRNNKINQLKQQISSEKSRCGTLQEELTIIEDKLLKDDGEISEAGNRLRDAENEESRITEKIASVGSDIATVNDEYKAHIAALGKDKDSAFEIANKMSELRNTMNSSVQQIELLQHQLERGQSDFENAQAAINELKSKNKQLAEDILKLREEIEQNRTQMGNEFARLSTVEKECKTVEDELNGIVDQIKMTRARKNLLEEIHHSENSGLFRGVRAALALKDTGRLTGIHGIVGELITVPKGYEVAIETALGGAIQNIITSNAEVAKQAINILKQNKAGKATFLPLDIITAPPVVERPNAKGCLGVALEIIQFNPKYYTAMSNMLGRILIFDNIDNAVEFTRVSRKFGSIVTLDGEIVRSSGAMTGGGEEKKSQGILTRQREIEELASKITSLESKERSVRMNYSRLANERDNLSASTRDRETAITKRENSLRFFENTYETNKQSLAEKEASFKNVTSDREELDSTIKRLQQDHDTAENEIKNLEQQDKELSAALEKQKSVQKDIEARLNALNSIQGEHKVKLAQVTERRKAIQKEIDSTNRRKKESVERKERINQEVYELTGRSKASEETVNKYQAEIDDFSKQREVLVAAMDAVKEEYKAMTDEIDKLDKQYQSRVKIVDSHRRKLNELDVELAEVNTNISSKEGVLAGDYAYNEDPALFNAAKYESREDLAGNINKKKFEQGMLGPVNPLAIEDYRTTKERYDNLQAQIKDLNDAAASLEQAIGEIEKISAEKFQETFNLINTAFGNIFEILFPGGSGSLKLTDKDDILNSNVDIVCRLPGKKLTKLELFSGGEKSFISLALLFSILEVKPPAFCLLDEVEAALDEANVKRFNRMLRTFADKTQFLIITHNKETMQNVDVIYGVTMKSGGISRHISIRLEDKDTIKEFTVEKGQSKERNIKLTEASA